MCGFEGPGSRYFGKRAWKECNVRQLVAPETVQNLDLEWANVK